MTKLTDAAKAGNTELVRRLLAEGANPMQKNWLGDTALIRATCYGHTEIAEALLAIDPSVAHINHANEFATTALIYAASYGHTAIVQALLALDPSVAHINHAEKEGATALICAAYNGHTEIVEALLAIDTSLAHINHAAKDGATALMCAARFGHTEIAEALLAIDPSVAHINHPGKGGKTALIYAAYHGHTEIAEALLAMDPSVAHINHVNKDGTPALMYAVAHGQNDVIKQLCQHKQQLFTQKLEEEFSDDTTLTKAQTDSLNAILRDMDNTQIQRHVLSQVKPEHYQAIIDADKTHIRWNWLSTEPFRLLAKACQAAQTRAAKLAEGPTPGMMIN